MSEASTFVSEAMGDLATWMHRLGIGCIEFQRVPLRVRNAHPVSPLVLGDLIACPDQPPIDEGMTGFAFLRDPSGVMADMHSFQGIPEAVLFEAIKFMDAEGVTFFSIEVEDCGGLKRSRLPVEGIYEDIEPCNNEFFLDKRMTEGEG